MLQRLQGSAWLSSRVQQNPFFCICAESSSTYGISHACHALIQLTVSHQSEPSRCSMCRFISDIGTSVKRLLRLGKGKGSFCDATF